MPYVYSHRFVTEPTVGLSRALWLVAPAGGGAFQREDVEASQGNIQELAALLVRPGRWLRLRIRHT